MARALHDEFAAAHRRSLLDLAPLELDCMNTLWPMGEGTVREIRDRLAPVRPRAYTTIMTIMDRLARKGVVERRKVGRAYMYRPNLSADEARADALGQVVKGFFGGSTAAVMEQLGETGERSAEGGESLCAAAVVGGGIAGPGARELTRPSSPRPLSRQAEGIQPARNQSIEITEAPEPAKREEKDAEEEPRAARLDATLL